MQLQQEKNEKFSMNDFQKLDPDLKKNLEKLANTIRGLSIDGVQKANSGHPGLPLGCAEIGAHLYGHWLKHASRNPKWVNRDRFILSAGHGSMFLYSCLHLAGFDLSIKELQNFRQLHSKTPGHPESLDTEGVETTTGPLGQGLATAIGQALGLKILAKKFNTKEHQIFTSKVYTLVGDGCIMEGISSEASSLAGHLKLDNLVVIYDSNDISLDGPLTDSCSENTKMRYQAYGWQVFEVNGHDLDALHQVMQSVEATQGVPCLVIAKTVIGKGSPNKAGTHKVHGAPLGQEEVIATKEALGLPTEEFYVPKSVQTFMKKQQAEGSKKEQAWGRLFGEWAKANPEFYQEFEWMAHQRLPDDLEEQLMSLEVADAIAGRNASKQVLQKLVAALPQLYGGSADLSCSDQTFLQEMGVVAPGVFNGRNIKYGVREFAMAAIATGLAQTRMITPFVGTFLTFSDYMRNAIRLAALMKEKVIYQFTHDSIFLGEDGPTHQPVEHFAALRAIPNLYVFRPADQHEVRQSWIAALKYEGPSALILSRQNLPTFECSNVKCSKGVGKGAYILKKEKEKADYTFFATGSEVSLALNVSKELEKRGRNVRVVSVPCWELFNKQDKKYKQSIIGGDLGKRISIEAGVELGWRQFIGLDGIAICLEGFGASAPASVLAKEFGFEIESILERIL